MANESYGDIRTLTPDEHWAHFAKSWRALQSYTYLGKTTPVMDAGVEREMMPLRHDMRNSTGGVMAAPEEGSGSKSIASLSQRGCMADSKRVTGRSVTGHFGASYRPNPDGASRDL